MPISSFRGEYSFLSNFYPSPIAYEGRIYPTNENFFQAMKTTDKAQRQQFSHISPALAKRAGRKLKLRGDWEPDLKKRVMLYGLRQKFSNPELKEMLLNTGDEELIEGNNWGDTYWGVCNGIGMNMLGKMLMLVRIEMRKETEDALNLEEAREVSPATAHS